MSSLTRTKVDIFELKDSIKIDEILLKENNIISIEKYFEDKEKIELNNRKKELFLNGVKLSYDLEDGLYRIYNNNIFIGLGIIIDKLLKRDIII